MVINEKVSKIWKLFVSFLYDLALAFDLVPASVFKHSFKETYG